MVWLTKIYLQSYTAYSVFPQLGVLLKNHPFPAGACRTSALPASLSQSVQWLLPGWQTWAAGPEPATSLSARLASPGPHAPPSSSPPLRCGCTALPVCVGGECVGGVCVCVCVCVFMHTKKKHPLNPSMNHENSRRGNT